MSLYRAVLWSLLPAGVAALVAVHGLFVVEELALGVVAGCPVQALKLRDAVDNIDLAHIVALIFPRVIVLPFVSRCISLTRCASGVPPQTRPQIPHSQKFLALATVTMSLEDVSVLAPTSPYR